MSTTVIVTAIICVTFVIVSVEMLVMEHYDHLHEERMEMIKNERIKLTGKEEE